jgi:hypothetical protein
MDKNDMAPSIPIDLKIRKSFGRSAITNGVVELDARSKLAKRFKDICSAILADQACEEDCPEIRLQLIRRFSAIAVMAENLEAKMANGETIRTDVHAQLTNALVKVASRIGIDRRSKNITPTLRDYLDDQAEVVE